MQISAGCLRGRPAFLGAFDVFGVPLVYCYFVITTILFGAGKPYYSQPRYDTWLNGQEAALHGVALCDGE